MSLLAFWTLEAAPPPSGGEAKQLSPLCGSEPSNRSPLFIPIKPTGSFRFGVHISPISNTPYYNDCIHIDHSFLWSKLSIFFVAIFSKRFLFLFWFPKCPPVFYASKISIFALPLFQKGFCSFFDFQNDSHCSDPKVVQNGDFAATIQKIILYLLKDIQNFHLKPHKRPITVLLFTSLLNCRKMDTKLRVLATGNWETFEKGTPFSFWHNISKIFLPTTPLKLHLFLLLIQVFLCFLVVSV